MSITTDSKRSIRSIIPNVKDQYDYLAKVIIIGSSNTGKSSILHRFIKNDFNEILSSQTIGVEFSSKIMKTQDDTSFKLQLWDTAGQERFRSLTRSYYRGSAGVVLCFDSTNFEQTFNELDGFIQDIKALCNDPSIVLVGNKCDLESEDNDDRINDFIQRNQITGFLKTSAKNGDNIYEIFYLLSESILDKISKGEIDPEDQSFGVQYGDNLLIPNTWDNNTLNSSRFNTIQHITPRNIIKRKKTTLSLIDRTLDNNKNTCFC